MSFIRIEAMLEVVLLLLKPVGCDILDFRSSSKEELPSRFDDMQPIPLFGGIVTGATVLSTASTVCPLSLLFRVRGLRRRVVEPNFVLSGALLEWGFSATVPQIPRSCSMLLWFGSIFEAHPVPPICAGSRQYRRRLCLMCMSQCCSQATMVWLVAESACGVDHKSSCNDQSSMQDLQQGKPDLLA